MFAQLVAVAFLAISAQSAVAASCSRSYTVQVGDYCDKISQAQNVSTFQLAAVNSDNVNTDCSNLVPGQSLCLAQNDNEDCRTTYVVLNGDTCTDVAQKNGVNTTILTLNNPQINEACSNIYVGEVLCTSKTVQAPPIPAGGVALPAPDASSTTLSPAAVTPVATPANTPAAVTPPAAAAPATTSAPSSADDSCDDDSDDSTTTDDNSDDCDADDAAGSATPAPAKAAPATPATTPAPAPASDNSDDGDDDDLPFCDEL